MNEYSFQSPRLRQGAYRAKVLGFDFDTLSVDETVELVREWRANRYTGMIALTNPHSLMLCRRDQVMAQATQRAGVRLPDGVGISWGSLLSGGGPCGRMPGPDLMLGVLDRGRELGLKHFFLGGTRGVSHSLGARVSESYPGVRVVGTHEPPLAEWDSGALDEAVAVVNEAMPDVLWVGFGAPKQEKWIARHIETLKVAAAIGVGAAFDFTVDRQKRAPGAMRALGLEWLFRLGHEPERLIGRNIDSVRFLGAVLAERWRERFDADRTAAQDG